MFGRSGEPRHSILSALLWIGMVVVVVLMGVRVLPSSMSTGRAIPELASFIPLALPFVVIALVCALFWNRRVLATLCTFCVAALLLWHAGYFIPSGSLSSTAESTVEAGVSTDDNVMRIMTLNTHNGDADVEQIVQTVRDEHVEVLALEEVTDSFLEELQAAGIDDVLPYHVYGLDTNWDNGGTNCLFSTAPMSNTSSNLLTIETSAMPAGSIQVGGKTLRFVAVHPNSPHKGGQDIWSRGLETIESLSEYDHYYVIMGDFNSTWDHSRFRELLGTSFVDAGEQAGEGYHMTYPNKTWMPALIEIDHIVYAKDSGIFVGDLETVAIDGTDHLALLGTLEV